MIALDISPFSTVTTCTCGWRRATLDHADAWKLAAMHARHVHADTAEADRCEHSLHELRRRRRRGGTR